MLFGVSTDGGKPITMGLVAIPIPAAKGDNLSLLAIDGLKIHLVIAYMHALPPVILALNIVEPLAGKAVELAF